MWNNLVLLAVKGLKYPVFVSDRSQPNKDLGRLQNFLRDKLYPNAAGYIAQTKKAAEVCRKKGWNTNISVIGNPVRKVEADTSVDKENIVLTVGRLIPTKHTDLLIRIFADLEMPGWKLVIVGGNTKRMNLLEEYKKLVEDLGVTDRVLLEGERQNVDDYYNKAKVFAFTSSSEGFPNVIGEAMSAGLPVIAFDCIAGPSDMIVDGENGFLIPLFDEKKFKSALNQLMVDEELRKRLGEKSTEFIKRFEVGNISNKFFEFITSSKSV